MIEKLESDELELTAELNKSHDQIVKAAEVKSLAEEEATRLNLIMRAAETEKQILQQEVQRLTDAIESLKNTTLESADT